MSYARWGADGSDVYVFLCNTGALECCGCDLNGIPEGKMFGVAARFQTTDEMIAHLNAHRAKGQHVCDDTIIGLVRDRDENDYWLATGGENPTPEQLAAWVAQRVARDATVVVSDQEAADE